MDPEYVHSIVVAFGDGTGDIFFLSEDVPVVNQV
jgi:hypothetical protein